jgi:hypothetical protein
MDLREFVEVVLPLWSPNVEYDAPHDDGPKTILWMYQSWRCFVVYPMQYLPPPECGRRAELFFSTGELHNLRTISVVETDPGDFVSQAGCERRIDAYLTSYVP